MPASRDQRNRTASEACFEAALVVNHTLQQMAEALRRLEIRVDVDVPAGVIVQGGFSELHQALGELVQRALDRTAAGGELAITVVSQAQGVAFEVADDGSAESASVVDDEGTPMIAGRIDGDTQHFFARIRALLTGFGGSLVLQDCPQGGSAITLWLPRRERRAVA